MQAHLDFCGVRSSEAFARTRSASRCRSAKSRGALFTASGRNQLPGRFSGGRGHPGYAAPASGSTVPLPLGTYQPAPGHRYGLAWRGGHCEAEVPRGTFRRKRAG